ncbi:MAG: hypothetical protein ACK4VO_07190 [Pseudobdellovibrio sp.]
MHKVKILIVIAVVSFNAAYVQARIIFLNDSMLPTDLQMTIESEIYKRCSISEKKVVESMTEVTLDKVDQNIFSYHYSTEFNVFNSDGSVTLIDVYSYKYNIDNPSVENKTGVNAIYSHGYLCK